LNTFHPQHEADYLMEKNIGDGFQLVYNVINQRAKSVITKAEALGYGVIARMPLQFGLLTGAITEDSSFTTDDHRHFRLTKEIIQNAIAGLEHIWAIAEKKGIPKTTLALSFCAKTKGISTVIPGIKTPAQAELNTDIIELDDSIMKLIEDSFSDRFSDVVSHMEKQG